MKTENITYTLLKDLPNVNAGAEIKLSNSGVNYTATDKQGLVATFQRKLIENNPEWFQLREPKQWDIVKAKTSNGILFTKKDGLFYSEVFSPITEVALPASLLEIISVKRLSDGVEFSVGDTIGSFERPRPRIMKFQVSDRNDMIVQYAFGHKLGWINLSNLTIPLDAHNKPLSEDQLWRIWNAGYEYCSRRTEENTPPYKSFREFLDQLQMLTQQSSTSPIQTYTHEQYLKAQEEAFNAALEMDSHGQGLRYTPKYPTFKDYIASKKS